MPGNPNWRTPTDFYSSLHAKYYFTLDAAAAHENALCDLYYTQEGLFRKRASGWWRTNEIQLPGEHGNPPYEQLSTEDGLTGSWHGQHVFLNPPYNHIRPWVEKAWIERLYNTLTVMILPPSIDTQWFHRYVWDKRLNRPREAVEVEFLEGRVRFVDPTTENRVSPPTGTMIVTFWPLLVAEVPDVRARDPEAVPLGVQIRTANSGPLPIGT